MNVIIILFSTLVYTNGLNHDDQVQEFVAARCYSKCLQIFIRFKSALSGKLSKPVIGQTSISPTTNRDMPQLAFVDEVAHQLAVTRPLLQSCLEDSQNQCSRQCFKTCATTADCLCQQNDVGCIMACHYRKEIIKEVTQEECPFISNVEESALKIPISRCPKTCKSRSDCIHNQQCCTTETCGPICLQIEGLKNNLPKYTPTPTSSSTSSNIEFDWSGTFTNHLKNELPLVFILQTRTCLCNKIVDKYVTPWQTLIMTHRLGAKLNALDNGTIYQFRLAAVTPHGTNGFGSVSENLPSIISKPAFPYPPENFLEFKWQVTDDNLFRIELKWDEPKQSLWRNFEYMLSWMIDHGIVQSGGEPMSSLTQYTKVLPGSDHRSTIDNLRPSTTYKIQIVTKTEWPGFGDIMSEPSTLYVTTPSTTSDHSTENMVFNAESKPCSCPDSKIDQSNIRISSPIYVNGDLQITVNMGKHSDYLIDIYPEVCIKYPNEKNSKDINRFRKLYKQKSEITLENLLFNCRYSLEITGIFHSTQKSTNKLCFCTPPCLAAYHGKNCFNDDISILPTPKSVKYSLFNFDTMTYKVSWEAMNNNILQRNGLPSITRFRVLWAPRMFEPVPMEHYSGITGLDPIFDVDRSDVRIIQSNITKLLLRNLTRDQLYIVRIQSLAMLENGQLLESQPITIFLPTHGYSELYSQNSQIHLIANRYLVLFVLRIIHQILHLFHLY